MLRTARCLIRPWHPDDRDALVALANNRAIWRNMRDQFPHPYTFAAADAWIAATSAERPVTHFAIEATGVIGGIGLTRRSDIYVRTGEVGYWIGEPSWGRGFAAEALSAFAPWCFETFDLVRLSAAVFVWNPASARVLEKAGFTRESCVRNAAFKDGQVVDEWVYALVREEGAGPTARRAVGREPDIR